MSIAACTTWDCINSFANWLAALGTILISGLALWLSVKDRMINLRAELNVAIVPGSNPTVLDTNVYALSFTNVGPRSVTVTNHCWFIPLKKGVIYLQPHMDPQLGALCSKLPIELTDGKIGHAFYPQDVFAKLDEPEKFLFHKNRFIAWLRIRFFRVRIDTTIGRRIKVHVKPVVRRKLWCLYKNA